MRLKLISWNVNGIRSIHGKGLAEFLIASEADVLCLQETKADVEQASALALHDSFERYWNPAIRKGYSGTAILTRQPVLRAWNGIGVPEHDGEGRVLTVEFDTFFLVNVYVPNAKRDLSRLDYRSRVWDPAFLKFLKDLERKKPVVACGDFNVAHQDIDLARPRDNRGNAGFTPEEREGFDAYVRAGFIDTFREFEKETGHYTWWSYMNSARPRNIGWRIDYFLISPSLRPRLQSAFICPEIQGSDHCPVGITLDS